MARNIKEQVDQILVDRQTAYQLTFGTEAAKTVLADLARFCRAEESTFHQDPRAHALLEGRREVWLRLKDHLNLPTEQFLNKHRKESK